MRTRTRADRVIRKSATSANSRAPTTGRVSAMIKYAINETTVEMGRMRVYAVSKIDQTNGKVFFAV